MSSGRAVVDGAITVELPIPPPACHPNHRCHWTERATANSAMRQWAAYRAQGAMRDGDVRGAWRSATVTVQARYRDRRRRDNDGLLASLKSALDGIVDSGLLVDDDQLTYIVLPPVIDRTRDAGVTITVTEAV